jgi:16S rRNA (guanine(966)-N(2))-methyltransferase RsmD
MFGSLKGMSIKPASGRLKLPNTIKPTTAMTRSVLFNLVSHNNLFAPIELQSAKIIDLCCGSGVIGLEFISMGAQSVTFIDSDYVAINLVRETARHLGVEDKIETRIAVAPIFLPENSVDVLFFDPPYDDDPIIHRQLNLLGESKSISKYGVVVLEADVRFKPSEYSNLALKLQRKVNSKSQLLIFVAI